MLIKFVWHVPADDPNIYTYDADFQQYYHPEQKIWHNLSKEHYCRNVGNGTYVEMADG